ncbi:TfoX/Sxy family protein [Diplocloster modestus]|uniref:TfoX/Sxy family protein n=1 Tax=Diplocloster modestus TaxID=2850322 RepID=A0ABS6KAH1_9FIRM|nr:TfoX/Sxy family protein [Diplocloster modestus]
MGELGKLPNIGKVVEEQLAEVGITTQEQLREAGSKQAWLKILGIDDSACYNRLCGLEGAIEGIRWHQLTQEKKDELREFYKSVKK